MVMCLLLLVTNSKLVNVTFCKARVSSCKAVHKQHKTVLPGENFAQYRAGMSLSSAHEQQKQHKGVRSNNAFQLSTMLGHDSEGLVAQL